MSSASNEPAPCATTGLSSSEGQCRVPLLACPAVKAGQSTVAPPARPPHPLQRSPRPNPPGLLRLINQLASGLALRGNAPHRPTESSLSLCQVSLKEQLDPIRRVPPLACPAVKAGQPTVAPPARPPRVTRSPRPNPPGLLRLIKAMIYLTQYSRAPPSAVSSGGLRVRPTRSNILPF